MVNKVGIVGATGSVGSKVLKHLLPKAEKGEVELVVYHRQGRAPKDLPSTVETRVIDLENGTVASIAPLVKDITVFVAALPAGGASNETILAEALSRSGKCVTFIPSIYGTEFTSAEKQHEKLGPLLTHMHTSKTHGQSKGLGITEFHTGLFADWLPFLEIDLKKNELSLNEGQRKHSLNITTMEHLGSVIADLVASDLEKIKNVEQTVITFQPTGDDLVELFTKINGQAPKVKPWGEKQVEDTWNGIGVEPAMLGPIKNLYMTKWTDGTFLKSQPLFEKHAAGPSLEQFLRNKA